ncbi:CC0125/CC1285 family lipoprotein [Faecalibacter rhinopitheci]|uniref:Lipoprotein n=1 Tax=Faecalibacter rhinopitheci TaxID=2779678 RepID=A0A8J7K344_9FLAO|nr:hypothetical protein [Faecalibacter rhinopitheci]MBF0596123.1 hypothetical protein [Faecalibacter rhinopitheci]
MKKFIFLMGLISITVSMQSCSSNKSTYQQTTEVVTSDFSSGYFEKNIKGNEYEVSYRGLGMSQNKVFDLSMLRAAEITKDKGYKNFVVLSKTADFNQVKNHKIRTNSLKIALYNDVPSKYQSYYNAISEYDRLSKNII